MCTNRKTRFSPSDTQALDKFKFDHITHRFEGYFLYKIFDSKGQEKKKQSKWRRQGGYLYDFFHVLLHMVKIGRIRPL